MNLNLLPVEFDQFPAVGLFLHALDSREVNNEVLPRQGGIEIRFLNEVSDLPNRARLRIYLPAEGKCVLFFYKRSSIPFSRDRFSYGGVVIDARSTGRFGEEDIQEWINFLVSGLQPKTRPKTLKKSVPYTIPEDEE